MFDVIIYLTVFITGVMFGSFFTLAIHRVPKKEDIWFKRSYCPKCNHRLGFWDLIPVLSYLFLMGKCRYCKEKIRIRYLLIELSSGFILLSVSMLINLSEIIYKGLM